MLLYYTFIIEFAGERIFEIGELGQSYEQKG